MSEPLVLIYNIEGEEKKETVLEILNSKNIDYRILKDKDVFQRVGYLAGIEGFREIDSENLPERGADSEMVLFANFEEEDLIDLLKNLKEKNVYIPLKAGLTETNINWILNDLILHVDEENEMMQAYTSMLKDVNGIDKIIDEKSPLLIMLLNEAKEMGKKQNLTTEEIKVHHKKILDEYRRAMSRDIL